MRRAAVVLVGVAGVVYGCASFSGTTDEGPGGGTIPEAGAAPPDGGDAGAPVGSDAAADTSARCDGGCVFFEDAFERDTDDVLGMWSTREGVPTLVPEEPRGNVFAAAMADAGGGGAERVSILRKTIAPRTSVRVTADLRVLLDGTFGSGAANDYCDFIDVYVETSRIATIFMDATGLGAWQLGGSDTYFAPAPVLLENWTPVELVVTSGPTLSVTARAGGSTLTLTPQGGAMLPGGPMDVQIGLRCAGVTPAIHAYLDNVVLRSIP